MGYRIYFTTVQLLGNDMLIKQGSIPDATMLPYLAELAECAVPISL